MALGLKKANMMPDDMTAEATGVAPKDLEAFFKQMMAGPRPKHEFHGDIQYTPEGNLVLSFESWDAGAATFKLIGNATELMAFREKPKPKDGKAEYNDVGCCSICD